MRIAIICQNFPPASFEGGISHYSSLLAKFLKIRGHKIYAITSTEYSIPVSDSEKSYGVETIFVKGPWNHKTVRRIRKIAIYKRINILILQYSPASFHITFRLKWALSRFPCQKITTFHTLWGKGFDRIIGIMNLIGCKKIIATNSEIMAILEKRLPFLLKKTYWIPIASNIIPNSKKDEINQNETPIISYFGMLYPGKGLELILDVIELLKKKGYNFSFKFIGGEMLGCEAYGQLIRKEIIKKELCGYVEILGLVSGSEVSEWLYKSRFIFLPYEMGLSDRRGSLMAAIAHGKAILTSFPKVMMPYLKNGRNIYWPESLCKIGYMNAAKKLLEDDKFVHRLEEGAKKLSKKFTWCKIGADYLMVIND